MFNALGATLWAPIVALSGWFLGHMIETVLGDLQRIQHWLLLAFAGIGIVVWWWRSRGARP